MKQINSKRKGHDEKSIYARRWIVTILYVLFIFAFLPLFPIVWGFFSRFSPGLLKGLTHLLIPAIVVFFFAYSYYVARKRHILFYLWSAIFLFAYIPLVYFYCEFTAERFHLAEYGLLVILVYRCLKLRMKTPWIYPAIILFSFSVGLLDEIIQGILPNRVYDFRDVVINWASSLLPMALVAGITWKRQR